MKFLFTLPVYNKVAQADEFSVRSLTNFVVSPLSHRTVIGLKLEANHPRILDRKYHFSFNLSKPHIIMRGETGSIPGIIQVF